MTSRPIIVLAALVPSVMPVNEAAGGEQDTSCWRRRQQDRGVDGSEDQT